MAALFNTTLVLHPTGGVREESFLSTSGVQLAPILYNSNNISDAVNRMDESMTDNIRSSSKSTRTSGQAYLTETFIQVRWLWLILPIALPIMTIFLLITMVLETWREPVLRKSSLFPLLMGRLQPIDEHNIAHLRHLDQVQSLSKRIKVKISQEEGSLLFSER